MCAAPVQSKQGQCDALHGDIAACLGGCDGELVGAKLPIESVYDDAICHASTHIHLHHMH